MNPPRFSLLRTGKPQLIFFKQSVSHRRPISINIVACEKGGTPSPSKENKSRQPRKRESVNEFIRTDYSIGVAGLFTATVITRSLKNLPKFAGKVVYNLQLATARFQEFLLRDVYNPSIPVQQKESVGQVAKVEQKKEETVDEKMSSDLLDVEETNVSVSASAQTQSSFQKLDSSLEKLIEQEKSVFEKASQSDLKIDDQESKTIDGADTQLKTKVVEEEIKEQIPIEPKTKSQVELSPPKEPSSVESKEETFVTDWGVWRGDSELATQAKIEEPVQDQLQFQDTASSFVQLAEQETETQEQQIGQQFTYFESALDVSKSVLADKQLVKSNLQVQEDLLEQLTSVVVPIRFVNMQYFDWKQVKQSQERAEMEDVLKATPLSSETRLIDLDQQQTDDIQAPQIEVMDDSRQTYQNIDMEGLSYERNEVTTSKDGSPTQLPQADVVTDKADDIIGQDFEAYQIEIPTLASMKQLKEQQKDSVEDTSEAIRSAESQTLKMDIIDQVYFEDKYVQEEQLVNNNFMDTQVESDNNLLTSQAQEMGKIESNYEENEQLMQELEQVEEEDTQQQQQQQVRVGAKQQQKKQKYEKDT
eukprot:TRINITY_DN7912_c0_g1_i3.p1 TRINITY_DN7912_c0_g1~~TRINITY_DN7912_c0_g1_i3.p1  ORF type:complete len:589 (+),score=78.40 TRINITY_DN7912_c0_g1_i3:86-1852(+)